MQAPAGIPTIVPFNQSPQPGMLPGQNQQPVQPVQNGGPVAPGRLPRPQRATNQAGQHAQPDATPSEPGFWQASLIFVVQNWALCLRVTGAMLASITALHYLPALGLAFKASMSFTVPVIAIATAVALSVLWIWSVYPRT